MNVFDILLGLALLYAAYRGFRQGTVVQLCGLVGIFVAVFFASRYGHIVGEWLHTQSMWGQVIGFVLVFVLTLLVVALGARVIKRIFSLAGFGTIDSVLGLLLGMLKMTLILGIILTLFETLNQSTHWVSDQKCDESMLYGPVCDLSDVLLPYLHRAFTETVL